MYFILTVFYNLLILDKQQFCNSDLYGCHYLQPPPFQWAAEFCSTMASNITLVFITQWRCQSLWLKSKRYVHVWTTSISSTITTSPMLMTTLKKYLKIRTCEQSDRPVKWQAKQSCWLYRVTEKLKGKPWSPPSPDSDAFGELVTFSRHNEPASHVLWKPWCLSISLHDLVIVYGVL